jgi:hypothetical protein
MPRKGKPNHFSFVIFYSVILFWVFGYRSVPLRAPSVEGNDLIHTAALEASRGFLAFTQSLKPRCEREEPIRQDLRCDK